MFRPKHHEWYWYIGCDDHGTWGFYQKENENDWLDQYYISMKNAYPTREEAKKDSYEQLQRLVGEEEAYTIWNGLL